MTNMKLLFQLILFLTATVVGYTQTPNSLGAAGDPAGRGVQSFTHSASAQVDTLTIALVDGTDKLVAVAKNAVRGSESWRSAYVDGDPYLGFKSKFHELLGAWDWYHMNDDWRKMGYIAGAYPLDGAVQNPTKNGGTTLAASEYRLSRQVLSRALA